jgi:hypothetical protein
MSKAKPRQIIGAPARLSAGRGFKSRFSKNFVDLSILRVIKTRGERGETSTCLGMY